MAPCVSQAAAALKEAPKEKKQQKFLRNAAANSLLLLRALGAFAAAAVQVGEAVSVCCGWWAMGKAALLASECAITGKSPIKLNKK